MAWFGIPAWWRSRRQRAKDPFSRARKGELDIVKAPPYQVPLEDQLQRRAQVEALIAGLNGGLDANWASREVLYNLINGWMLEWIANVDAQRDERQAVLDILIGLAAEELARREARYEADLARVEQTRMALEVAFEALTGRKVSDFVAPELRRVGERRRRGRREPDEKTPTGSSPGPETIAPEATGPEATGPEATGPETIGPEATGPETIGPETTASPAPADPLVDGSSRTSPPPAPRSTEPSPNGHVTGRPESVPRQARPPTEDFGSFTNSTDTNAAGVNPTDTNPTDTEADR